MPWVFITTPQAETSRCSTMCTFDVVIITVETRRFVILSVVSKKANWRFPAQCQLNCCKNQKHVSYDTKHHNDAINFTLSMWFVMLRRAQPHTRLCLWKAALYCPTHTTKPCVVLTSLFMSSGQCGVALDRNDGRYVCNVLSGFAPNARTLSRGYRRLSCSCRLKHKHGNWNHTFS